MTLVSSFFDPISPRHDVRSTLEKYFQTYLKPDMVVYDIGCGSKPFAASLKGRVKAHIGVDIENGFYDARHIDLIGTAYDVPASPESADAVISSQVIEHLDRPLDALKEACRLLKPGGILFLSFPFIYPIHAAPYDYLRYTNHYLEKKLPEYGFEILDEKSIGGFWYCLGVFSGHYFRKLDRGPLRITGLVRLLIWIIKWLFRLGHEGEDLIFKLTRKDITAFRNPWTSNYIFVARKKAI